MGWSVLLAADYIERPLTAKVGGGSSITIVIINYPWQSAKPSPSRRFLRRTLPSYQLRLLGVTVRAQKNSTGELPERHIVRPIASIQSNPMVSNN